MTRIRSGDAPTGIRPEGGNVSGFLSILVCSVIAVVSWVCHGWCHNCVIGVVSWVCVMGLCHGCVMSGPLTLTLVIFEYVFR